MTVVGVTGTTGKTTTTHLLAAIFEHAGLPCGVIGTLTGAHTTPEAPELQARLAGFRDEGRRAVAMEVSSHALEQHRADATHFAVAVFTNLGRDHLDFHGTIERYFAAKARLFDAGAGRATASSTPTTRTAGGCSTRVRRPDDELLDGRRRAICPWARRRRRSAGGADRCGWRSAAASTSPTPWRRRRPPRWPA